VPAPLLRERRYSFRIPLPGDGLKAQLLSMETLRFFHQRSLILWRAGSWFNDIRQGRTPPSYAWEIRDGQLLVETSGPVKAVSLWQATDAENLESRDFRLETLGPAWTKQELQPLDEGIYGAALETPAQGVWTAYSIEVVFAEDSLFEANQVFTTDVVVLPNSLPRNPNDHCMNP
jgi:PhoPQ-activated pathogenicity-related protein